MDLGLRRLRTALEDVRVFASARSRRRFLLYLGIGLLVMVAILVLAREYLTLLKSPGELRGLIRDLGPFGPIALIALQAAQVVLAPVPGQVLAVVGGYLYGTLLGTAYNMIGIAIGSTVAFWLSRQYGRPYVTDIVHEDLLARFDALDDDHVRIGLFVVFLFPGLPDDALCFIGGLTRLPIWQLVTIAIVGRIPAFAIVNVIGDSIEAGEWGLAIALGAGILAVSLMGYLSRERILAYIERD